MKCLVKLWGCIFIAMIVPFLSTAQKLPNTQEISLRAPQSLKIDGKAIEWDNSFQAFNKSTRVFYTICNDNTNLYLLIQSENSGISNKILKGGITFTVNVTGKKSTNGAIAITYPLLTKNNKVPLSKQISARLGELNNDSKMSSEEKSRGMDSISNINNKNQIDRLTEIKVSGIKKIDNIISVYNEHGIKVSATLNSKSIFTYELALPLSYLGLSVMNLNSLLYNIRLNGANEGGANVGFPPLVSVGNQNAYQPGPGGIDMREFLYPTDFWGKYALTP